MAMVNPQRVVEAQSQAKSSNLLPYVGIAFLNGMGIGSNLAYAGLVLPHHTASFHLRQNATRGDDRAGLEGQSALLPLSPSEAS